MIVCHCHQVSERKLRTLIEAGVADTEAIASVCGAGGGCGGCIPAVEELIDEVTAERRACERAAHTHLPVLPASVTAQHAP